MPNFTARELYELASIATARSGATSEFEKYKAGGLLKDAADGWIDLTPKGTTVLENGGYQYDPNVGWKQAHEPDVTSDRKMMLPIKMPVVFGKNRTRGNSVGAMIDDMYGEHSELRSLLSKEARGQGVDPSTDWLTAAVASLLRLYEKSHDAWLSNKGDTIGHVFEAELPSGTKLLMGSRRILGQIDEVEIDGVASVDTAIADGGAPLPARLAPSFQVGQRFDFKAGDAVVSNGYRGTVAKVLDGQLAGMVEVRLPGGMSCVSATFPDCFPAVTNAIEVVTEGRFWGKVKEVSGQFVVQDAGRGKLVAHECHRFERLPAVGDVIDLQHRAGKVVVAVETEKARVNER